MGSLLIRQSTFGVSEVRFLGHTCNKHGVRPPAIQNSQKPETVKRLCGFPEMIELYRQFLPETTFVQELLNTMLKDPKGDSATFAGIKTFQHVLEARVIFCITGQMMFLSIPAHGLYWPVYGGHPPHPREAKRGCWHTIAYME